MRTVLFLGQKPIGQECFARLLAADGSGFRLVGAVSNTTLDNWWRDNAIATRCQRDGIPLVPNERRNLDLISSLAARYGVDTLVSVQHPWILPADLLAAATGGAFNLHLAPLPAYKGWHGCSYAILNGDAEYGVSLHWMAPEVDSGDMAFEDRFPVEPHDTAATLYARAERSGVRLFDLLLACFASGEEPPRRPLVGESSYYGRGAIEQHKHIRLEAGGGDLARRARAFHFPPFEPAYVLVDGRKYHVVPSGEGTDA